MNPYRDNLRSDSSHPPVTGIYAAISSVVSDESVPDHYRDRFVSMEQNAHAPLLGAESMAFVRSKLILTASSHMGTGLVLL